MCMRTIIYLAHTCAGGIHDFPPPPCFFGLWVATHKASSNTVFFSLEVPDRKSSVLNLGDTLGKKKSETNRTETANPMSNSVSYKRVLVGIKECISQKMHDVSDDFGLRNARHAETKF